VQFGMTPMQAIQSATITPATLLKKEAFIGSIEVDKIADILAVSNDVLNDISVLENIPFVMKDGVVVKDLVGNFAQ
jgi:imidazolonepropionase-like amidohydrolase